MTWKSLLPLLLLSCKPPSEADLEGTRGGRVDVMFNEPGTRRANMWEPDAVRLMIETIRDARSSIDMAVMGFGRDEVIDAITVPAPRWNERTNGTKHGDWMAYLTAAEAAANAEPANG